MNGCDVICFKYFEKVREEKVSVMSRKLRTIGIAEDGLCAKFFNPSFYNSANVRMMAMLTRMARSLLSTEESMATPRLVKAKGR